MGMSEVPREGVIKFSLDHQASALPDWAQVDDIQAWFVRCRELDLIGQHPDRYEGAAYGNISQRAEDGFLITGTQTGGKPRLEKTDICWVQHIDLQNNRLKSNGPIEPSSESMTHDQVYQHVPEANFVIHVHNKPLWQQAKKLGLAMTSPMAEYGTPEMAHEVERLLKDPALAQAGAFSMGGHEDGIVVFGRDAVQAGTRLEALVARVR